MPKTKKTTRRPTPREICIGAVEALSRYVEDIILSKGHGGIGATEEELSGVYMDVLEALDALRQDKSLDEARES